MCIRDRFNALDYKTYNDVKEIIRTLQAEGKTILMTSHNYEDIETLCNEVDVYKRQPRRRQTRWAMKRRCAGPRASTPFSSPPTQTASTSIITSITTLFPWTIPAKMCIRDSMKRRVRAIRFGRLSTPGLFSTARLVGSEVVWDNGVHCVRASINELLDSMQMD